MKRVSISDLENNPIPLISAQQTLNTILSDKGLTREMFEKA